MVSFNKVMLMGNLTRDIDLRESPSGPVAKFSLAINNYGRKRDEGEELKTVFVDVTAFGKQAQILQEHVGKGTPLFVEGRLEFSTWEKHNDKTGESEKRSKLAVILENFRFVGKGK